MGERFNYRGVSVERTSEMCCIHEPLDWETRTRAEFCGESRFSRMRGSFQTPGGEGRGREATQSGSSNRVSHNAVVLRYLSALVINLPLNKDRQSARHYLATLRRTSLMSSPKSFITLRWIPRPDYYLRRDDKRRRYWPRNVLKRGKLSGVRAERVRNDFFVFIIILYSLSTFHCELVSIQFRRTLNPALFQIRFHILRRIMSFILSWYYLYSYNIKFLARVNGLIIYICTELNR